jgi:putative membrane protein
MMRILLLTAAATTALSLAACHKNTQGNAVVAEGNTASSTMSSANPGQSAPVNAAQDATAAAVGATSAATMGAHDTGAFVDNVTQGNMYEIKAAQIAEQKSKSPDVKTFAKLMVTDHTAMANELKPLIAKAGKTPAAALDQRRQGLLDNLSAASAQDFDKTYIDQQVSAHEETLSLLKGYADNGDDAGLKAAAGKAAAKVQSHLDKAKAIQAKLAGG